ncbi:Serine/threonine-protein kinase HT1 [Platanthera guangdongensis]|uniref:Serine/threonine-protein kinase HT1 n=1 Tax=Platanthera guangdongensis TaxID=2320717 RepID=A0ABR2MS66_9ASPA
MTGETGSYRYMAPEVFKHRKYDKKVDVFSFAMILYEMLEGDPPLSNYEPYEAAKFIADGHRPTFRAKGYIPDLRESSCFDPTTRIRFLEIGRSRCFSWCDPNMTIVLYNKNIYILFLAVN